MKKFALLALVTLSLSACSDDGDSGEGGGNGGAAGGGDNSGGETSTGGGDSSGGSAGDSSTGGGDSVGGMGGTTQTTDPFAGKCVGTPSTETKNLCGAITVPMDCSPALGCLDVGTCEPKQTAQDCMLRAVSGCGTGSALNNCHVIGDAPENFTCVQTERASTCGDAFGQGACMGWDGSGVPAQDANVCQWTPPAQFTCDAAPCESAFISQMCGLIPGCTWQAD